MTGGVVEVVVILPNDGSERSLMDFVPFTLSFLDSLNRKKSSSVFFFSFCEFRASWLWADVLDLQ